MRIHALSVSLLSLTTHPHSHPHPKPPHRCHRRHRRLGGASSDQSSFPSPMFRTLHLAQQTLPCPQARRLLWAWCCPVGLLPFVSLVSIPIAGAPLLGNMRRMRSRDSWWGTKGSLPGVGSWRAIMIAGNDITPWQTWHYFSLYFSEYLRKVETLLDTEKNTYWNVSWSVLKN